MINFKNSKGEKIFRRIYRNYSRCSNGIIPLHHYFFIEFFMHSSCHNIQKLRISVKYISSYDA